MPLTLICPFCAGAVVISGGWAPNGLCNHMYERHANRMSAVENDRWGHVEFTDTSPRGIRDQDDLNNYCEILNQDMPQPTATVAAPQTIERSRMEGNRYYLEDGVNGVGGWFRQPPPVRIAGAEKILEAMAQNIGCVVNAAIRCDGGRIVRLNCKQGYVVMSTPIMALNLKTTFSVKAGYLVPEFHRENPDFLDLSIPWTVPPNMKIYLAVKALPNQWRPQHACLFAKIEGQSGSWRMPLSNTYGDGRICLGRTYDSMRKPSLQEVMQESLDLLDSASWNADLFEDGWRITSTQELFKFSAETRQPVYYANPASLCVRCNCATIEEAF